MGLFVGLISGFSGGLFSVWCGGFIVLGLCWMMVLEMLMSMKRLS